MEKHIQRTDLVLPELSYKIVGVLYRVYNVLGYGLAEIVYQRAVAEALKKESLRRPGRCCKKPSRSRKILR